MKFECGGGCGVSTTMDYMKFAQMLLEKGRFNGKRLLSRKTIELMTSNHIEDHPIWPDLAGYRFGLGFRVLSDLGASAQMHEPDPAKRRTLSLRIDRDILDHFQNEGPGWQDRINDALIGNSARRIVVTNLPDITRTPPNERRMAMVFQAMSTPSSALVVSKE